MYTPLQNAVRKGSFITVQKILEKGETRHSINASGGIFGYTALHEAIVACKPDIVRLLLENKADVNAKCKGDHTPLNLAASMGKSKCIEVLLEYNADINLRGKDEKTAFETANANNRGSCAELLYTKEMTSLLENDKIDEFIKCIQMIDTRNITNECFSKCLEVGVVKNNVKVVGIVMLHRPLNDLECLSKAIVLNNYESASMILLCYAASKPLLNGVLAYLYEETTMTINFGDEKLKEVMSEDIMKTLKAHVRKIQVEMALPVRIACICKNYDAAFIFLINYFCDSKNLTANLHGLLLPVLAKEWVKPLCRYKKIILSNNCIKRLPNMSSFCELNQLNLSLNSLYTVPVELFKLPGLQNLNLSTNKLKKLPYVAEWSPSLKVLKLEKNKLDSFPNLIKLCELTTLDLSDNCLDCIPLGVCLLKKLETLNVSRNHDIHEFPKEMAKLTKLNVFIFNNLKIKDPPEQYLNSTTNILYYLRAKLRDAKPYYNLKLMIIGEEDKGKTTLLHRLKDDNNFNDNISTVGIDIQEITMRSRMQGQPPFTFRVWDFGGQEEYYATHQCFLSARSLYVLLWNVNDGEEGVGKLKPWLETLLARVTNFALIIVGTKLDLLVCENKEDKCKEYEGKIAELLRSMPRYRSMTFMRAGNENLLACDVVIKFVSLMSNSTNYSSNIENLKLAIFEQAAKMTYDGTVNSMKVMGEKVPSSYLKLEQAIIERQKQMQRENKPPIISRNEFVKIGNSLNCEKDSFQETEDLETATIFLHNTGTILHFNDVNEGLRDVYFISPSWLCSMMAEIITVDAKHNCVTNGILDLQKIEAFIEQKWRMNCTNGLEKYMRLLYRFQIACELDEKRVLIPSKLPKTPSSLLSKSDRKKLLTRYHFFTCIPFGFWARFISRFLLLIEEMLSPVVKRQVDEKVLSENKDHSAEDNLNSLVDNDDHISETIQRPVSKPSVLYESISKPKERYECKEGFVIQCFHRKDSTQNSDSEQKYSTGSNISTDSSYSDCTSGTSPSESLDKRLRRSDSSCDFHTENESVQKHRTFSSKPFKGYFKGIVENDACDIHSLLNELLEKVVVLSSKNKGTINPNGAIDVIQVKDEDEYKLTVHDDDLLLPSNPSSATAVQQLNSQDKEPCLPKFYNANVEESSSVVEKPVQRESLEGYFKETVENDARDIGSLINDLLDKVVKEANNPVYKVMVGSIPVKVEAKGKGGDAQALWGESLYDNSMQDYFSTNAAEKALLRGKSLQILQGSVLPLYHVDAPTEEMVSDEDVTCDIYELSADDYKYEEHFNESANLAYLLDKGYLTCWSTGISFKHDQLCFSIQQVPSLEPDREAIETKVTKSALGYRVLNYVIDHIRTLIKEWYEGLLSDIGNKTQVSSCLACPVCNRLRIKPPHLFDINLVFDRIRQSEDSKCNLICSRNHSPQTVNLTEYCPDLVFDDLPCTMKLTGKDIQCSDERLGEGQSAEVYRGTFKSIPAAVKYYKFDENTSSLQSLYDMRQEVVMLSKLRHHPFIVQFLGFSLKPMCAVIELAQHGSLSSKLYQSVTIPRIVNFRICQQIASALAFMHEKNMIHRDIKSNNILLFSLSPDANINIKLTDFGTANFIGLAGLKNYFGTYGYSAPEIISHQSSIDEYTSKVDVYSYAILVYELIAVRVPFHDAENTCEKNRFVVEGLRPLFYDVPNAFCGLLTLTQLMLKMWQQNSLLRPTFNEIKRQLVSPEFQLIFAKHPMRESLHPRDMCFLRDYNELWVICDSREAQCIVVINATTTAESLVIDINCSNYGLSYFNLSHICPVGKRHVCVLLKSLQDVLLIYSSKKHRVECYFPLQDEYVRSITTNADSVFLGFQNGNTMKIPTRDFVKGKIEKNSIYQFALKEEKPILTLVIKDDVVLLSSESEDGGMIPCKLEQPIREIILSFDGKLFFVSFQSSWLVFVYDFFNQLYEIDCKKEIGMNYTDRSDLRVFCMCSIFDQLWLGTGSGHILVYKVDCNESSLLLTMKPYERETYILRLLPTPHRKDHFEHAVVSIGKCLNASAFGQNSVVSLDVNQPVDDSAIERQLSKDKLTKCGLSMRNEENPQKVMLFWQVLPSHLYKRIQFIYPSTLK